jgi:hypothetical protein
MRWTVDEPGAEGGDTGCSGGIMNLLGKGEGAAGAETAAAAIAGTTIVTTGAVITGAGARTAGAAMAASTTGVHSACCTWLIAAVNSLFWRGGGTRNTALTRHILRLGTCNY